MITPSCLLRPLTSPLRQEISISVATVSGGFAGQCIVPPSVMRGGTRRLCRARPYSRPKNGDISGVIPLTAPKSPKRGDRGKPAAGGRYALSTNMLRWLRPAIICLIGHPYDGADAGRCAKRQPRNLPYLGCVMDVAMSSKALASSRTPRKPGIE